MIVIGIKGLIGAGKTTVAKHLIERHGFTRGRFAGALKDMMRAFLAYRGASADLIERMVEGDLKDVPTGYLNGRSPREAMESLGSDWGRDRIHRDLWISAETDRLYVHQPKRVLFEDCRYPNEADAIRRMGGVIWEIKRPDIEPKDLPTEHAQRQIKADVIFVNEVGRLDRTIANVDMALASLLAAQGSA